MRLFETWTSLSSQSMSSPPVCNEGGGRFGVNSLIGLPLLRPRHWDRRHRSQLVLIERSCGVNIAIAAFLGTNAMLSDIRGMSFLKSRPGATTIERTTPAGPYFNVLLVSFWRRLTGRPICAKRVVPAQSLLGFATQVEVARTVIL